MGDSTTSTPDEERLRHRGQNEEQLQDGSPPVGERLLPPRRGDHGARTPRASDRVSQRWLVRRPTLLFLAVDGAMLAAAAAAALVAPLTDAGPPVG